MADVTDAFVSQPLIVNDVIGRDARDEKEQLPRVLGEFTALQADAARRIEQALGQFSADPDLQVDERVAGSPSQVVLKLTQPDGEPVTRVRVQVTGAESDKKLTKLGLQALQPLRDGSVVLKLPSGGAAACSSPSSSRSPAVRAPRSCRCRSHRLGSTEMYCR